MKDYYYILGIDRLASEIQIKSAYRKLSIKFHPDKNNGDKFFEDRFKEILEGYEILSNISKRKNYDLKLKDVKTNSPNESSIKKHEEELKKWYEAELKKKEAEIKLKYQTPGQREAEEVKREREEEEAKIYIEQRKLTKKINRLEELVTIKENDIKEYFKKIELTKNEIPEMKKAIDNLKFELASLS